MLKLAKIKSIEKMEPEDRYDVSVSDTHCFFANGILIHNCRMHAVIDEAGDVTFWSRAGHEFLTLDKLKPDVMSLGLKNTVLDGEICVVDENGDEDFQSIMKEIRRKDHTIERPRYMIFDMLTLEEFRAGSGSIIFSERLRVLPIPLLCNKLEHLKPVAQAKIDSDATLAAMRTRAADLGWEGLILRKDVAYEGKRTKNMLKVKDFCDAEYKVIDVEFGKIRYVKDGREVEEKMLSAVVILHEGNRVGVGSGFSIEERQKFYARPELIKGKIITVKYFEATKNQQGGSSLRFPTVKAIHGDEREV